MRYQLIQMIQLLFALSMVFGAFVGGITVGWWRWGRGGGVSPRGEGERPAPPGMLFSPEGRDDEIVLVATDLEITDSAVARLTAGEEPAFTPAPLGAGTPVPSLNMGLPKAASVIATPWDQVSSDAETLEA